MPMDRAEAIRRINNDELNCPRCKSDIILAEEGHKYQLVCRWCGQEWNVDQEGNVLEVKYES